MQNGFISIPVLIIVLVGLTLAGGGGYVAITASQSQKAAEQELTELRDSIERAESDKAASTTVDTSVDLAASAVPTTTEETANEQQTEVTDAQATSITPVSERSIVEAAPPVTQPVTIDACVNLPGIQTEIPEGFTISTSGCVMLEDVCFNIDGIQSSIPSGMLVFKGYGCLTESQMDRILDEEREESEAKAADKAAQSYCSETLVVLDEMEAEYEAIEAKYQAEFAAIGSSPGQTAGQANMTINSKKQQMYKELEVVEAERNQLLNEYVIKCTL